MVREQKDQRIHLKSLMTPPCCHLWLWGWDSGGSHIVSTCWHVYNSELEGQSTKTAQQNQVGGGKLENKWLFLVEDGVLIGEAEASGEAGERARKKYYLRLKMDPWLIPLSELNTPKMLWGEQEYWRRGGGEERRQEEVVRKRGQAVPVSSFYRPVSVQGQAAADYCWCPHVSPNQDN